MMMLYNAYYKIDAFSWFASLAPYNTYKLNFSLEKLTNGKFFAPLKNACLLDIARLADLLVIHSGRVFDFV